MRGFGLRRTDSARHFCAGPFFDKDRSFYTRFSFRHVAPLGIVSAHLLPALFARLFLATFCGTSLVVSLLKRSPIRIPPFPISKRWVLRACRVPRVFTTVSDGVSVSLRVTYRSINKLSAIGEKSRSVTESIENIDGDSRVKMLVTSSTLKWVMSLKSKCLNSSLRSEPLLVTT